ncbi:hypothetical protein [Pedobacter sp. SL55]|uniref:hypothetical protein n=1 Tax=Pedobacter sp. SL55 TaxID=2995161 RepID=UPI002271586E|nr:hypothetical protein [Pedobacter sp. SL55]WAC42565.1 hypothetical protein OVA16_09485 [Pedobacter sp. SL55]
MSNPFKKIVQNVKVTKSTMFDDGIKQQAEVATKTCRSCGAPRPINTNLVYCNYCQTPFMNIDANIKAEK